MNGVPERWRFRFDDEEVTLQNLSWADAARVFRAAESGDLTGQADGACASLEFNAAHAAVVYMGRDGILLRPYFPHRPAAAQDLTPFYCDGCGIRRGDRDEYLARFVSRQEGLLLFVAVLVGPSLPAELPDPRPGQPALPGCVEVAAELAAGRVLEWRPLPSEPVKTAGLGSVPVRTHN